MAFSSIRFFLFLAVILGLTRIPFSVRTKKWVLCTGSCLFYAAWDYRYLLLLLIISAVDYLCASRIASTDHVLKRRMWLALSVICSLGILGYFKYAGFFLHELRGIFILPAGDSWLPVILPAGISFYTFKSMSYTIDVYRRHIEPCRSRLDYTMFITFFPDLIAGPIVRASVFLPQMNRVPGPTIQRLREGGSLFVIGLGKKLLIADHVAVVSDAVFSAPHSWSTGTTWLGLIAYTLQIYCDFSGYSDMAIGTARMIGYDLPENFRMPYLARDVAEFWHRWHITLSEWLRDYLYIPLGGNRHGEGRTYLNLMITMLLGGLWHGASWNFVIWGALHGAALAVHRLYRKAAGSWRMPALPAWLVTILFVMLCWIPFRAPDLSTTMAILRALAGYPSGNDVWIPVVLIWGVALVGMAHAAGLTIERGAQSIHALDLHVRRDQISGTSVVFGFGSFRGVFLFVSLVLAIFFFGAVVSSPFIYFQF